MISSNSKRPRQVINWRSSMQPDEIAPNNNPRYHFSGLLKIRGSSIPAGNSNTQFSSTSCNIPGLPLIIVLYDHNGSNSHLLTPGILPNTVEPRTIRRKAIRIGIVMACEALILLFRNKKSELMIVAARIRKAMIISFIDHIWLYVVRI